MDSGEVATAQALVDTLDEAAAVLDQAGRVLLCNAKWRGREGCSLSGPSLGTPDANYAEQLRLVDGPLREPATQLAGLLESLLEGSRPLESRRLTFKADRLKGAPSWWRSIVRVAATHPRQFVVVHRDVTREHLAEEELRHSRARLRTIVTGAPIVLFAIDAKGVFSLVEGMGAAGASFASPDLVGQDVYEAYAHMPDLLDIVRGAFAGRVGVTTVAVGNLAYEVRCSPYVGQQRQADGVVGVATDVTERVKAQRMKDEFVSIVSHELRTPLTSIRGSLGLLEGGIAGPLSEKAVELTRIARTNADRLIRLINDILDLEKMESGRMELHRGTVDLVETCRIVVDELRGIATQAGVELVIEADAPVVVRADADRLHQVVTNLLSNAVKFSSDGDTARLVVEPGTTGKGRLSVHDLGPGIAPRDMERLFQKFSQLDSSSSRAKMGSGLGLVIAKSIVEAHGGRIWVESKEGEGSTFCIEVPLSAQQHTERDLRATPQSERDRTIAVDALGLRDGRQVSAAERARTLADLLSPAQAASGLAPLNEAHATAQILAAELGPGGDQDAVVAIRREIEAALRLQTQGLPVDWAALHAVAQTLVVRLGSALDG